MTESNRRRFFREKTNGPIQVILIQDNFEGPEDSCDQIPAKMVNQSEDGLYIEIDRALQPGSDVHFKMVEPEKDHPEDAYFMNDGRVVWCNRIDKKTSRFGVGVKILNKFVQAEILTSRLDRPV